jgi:ADP-ribosylation factor GTPase-activating protein 2/3
VKSSPARRVSRVFEFSPGTDIYVLQIGISSDQYFGRGSYDPQAASEARTRLQNFNGATAISSNAYFGRPEDEEEDLLSQEGGLLGELGQNETVAQLERGIRDMAGRLMANPDVQNLGDSLRTGALKVCPDVETTTGDRMLKRFIISIDSWVIIWLRCRNNDELGAWSLDFL